MLEIYAGKTALKTINEKGFLPDLFSDFLGASGGPKWFTLYALDKYMFGDFFKGRSDVLNLIGSSAGAFRASCFAQKDPVAAIERLASNYCQTIYSEKAKPQEVTTKARDLLAVLFGEHGASEIINNPVFKAHFIVAKCHGLVASENRVVQSLGLLASFLQNAIGRRHLKKQYQRYIFQTNDSTMKIHDPDNIATRLATFTQNNIKDALLASGSIPMVMQGIKDIDNCSQGMYRDGGLIDYHFDFEIESSGLILYPHFSSVLKAGWFDKKLKRKVRMQHYDKTVLICPSAKFIDSLPYHKIPDCSDFTTMQPQQRMAYWQQVFVQSEQLSLAFDHFYQQQNLSEIKPIEILS